MQNRERQSVLRKEKSGRVRGTKGSFYQHTSEILFSGTEMSKVHLTSGNTYCSSGSPGKQPRLPEPAWPGSASPIALRIGASEESEELGTASPPEQTVLTTISRQKPPTFPTHSMSSSRKARGQPGRWLKLPASSAKRPRSPPSIECPSPRSTPDHPSQGCSRRERCGPDGPACAVLHRSMVVFPPAAYQFAPSLV